MAGGTAGAAAGRRPGDGQVTAGWFRQTWVAPATLAPPGYGGERASATAILFLLAPGERSRWHQVRSDEVWLWHRAPDPARP